MAYKKGETYPTDIYFILVLFVYFLFTICLFIELVVSYSEVLQVAWICLDRLRILSGYFQNVHMKDYLLSSILSTLHGFA